MNEAQLLRIAVAAVRGPNHRKRRWCPAWACDGGIGTAPVAADSHYRYLSGLLPGIGVLFLTTIHRIETLTSCGGKQELRLGKR